MGGQFCGSRFTAGENEANAGSRVANFANALLWILVVVVGLVSLFLCLFLCPPLRGGL
jgi:hypothetical protein